MDVIESGQERSRHPVFQIGDEWWSVRCEPDQTVKLRHMRFNPLNPQPYEQGLEMGMGSQSNLQEILMSITPQQAEEFVRSVAAGYGMEKLTPRVGLSIGYHNAFCIENEKHGIIEMKVCHTGRKGRRVLRGHMNKDGEKGVYITLEEGHNTVRDLPPTVKELHFSDTGLVSPAYEVIALVAKWRG